MISAGLAGLVNSSRMVAAPAADPVPESSSRSAAAWSSRPVLAGPPRRPLPLVRLELRGGEVYAVGVEARTT